MFLAVTNSSPSSLPEFLMQFLIASLQIISTNPTSSLPSPHSFVTILAPNSHDLQATPALIVGKFKIHLSVISPTLDL